MVSLYNRANCFLMSAPLEDFGLTPVEAIACGCPVIAWGDGAGPNETVLKTSAGLIAKPYSLEDYANKINEALLNSWDKRKIADSINHYRQKTVSREFIKLIKKII